MKENFFFWPILPEREMGKGVTLQEVHLNNLMVTRVVMEKDSEIPLHSHPHEQITIVIRGKLRFNLGGVEKILRAGEGVKIPSGVEHSAVALEECECLDAWHPIKEDYIIEKSSGKGT